MFLFHWNHFLAVYWFMSFRLSLLFGEVIYGSQGYTACSSNSTTCTILCDSDSQCGYNGNTYESGGELHCPSNTTCQECNVICNGNHACRQAVIYGHSCTLLYVVFESGATVGRFATINAPSDGGSLHVNVSSLVTNDPFRDAIINSDLGTNEIIVDCFEGSGGTDDECKDITVNASNANYLELNCHNGVECESSDIYCPIESTLDKQVSKPCQINCDLNSRCDSFVHVASNAWGSDLEIGNYECHTCGLEVYCGGSNNDYCTIDSTTTCNGGNGGNGCDNPTVYPSFIPTGYPTTNQPTIDPTNEPSTSPTRTPTSNPSSNPTNKPSGQPSYNPTNEPIASTEPSSTTGVDWMTTAAASDRSDTPTLMPSSNEFATSDMPTRDVTNSPTSTWTALSFSNSNMSGQSTTSPLSSNTLQYASNDLNHAMTFVYIASGIIIGLLLSICVQYAWYKRKKSQSETDWTNTLPVSSIGNRDKEIGLQREVLDAHVALPSSNKATVVGIERMGTNDGAMGKNGILEMETRGNVDITDEINDENKEKMKVKEKQDIDTINKINDELRDIEGYEGGRELQGEIELELELEGGNQSANSESESISVVYDGSENENENENEKENDCDNDNGIENQNEDQNQTPKE